MPIKQTCGYQTVCAKRAYVRVHVMLVRSVLRLTTERKAGTHIPHHFQLCFLKEAKERFENYSEPWQHNKNYDDGVFCLFFPSFNVVTEAKGILKLSCLWYVSFLFDFLFLWNYSPTDEERKFSISSVYEGVSKSFRTSRLEREMKMVQLSATRCSCITILWVSLASFAAITVCVVSQRVVVVVYFVIDSVRKLLGTPS
jgi:hypothetical protein